MRLRYITLVLGLTLFAQTGCKSSHCGGEAVPPPPPPVYPMKVSPAPAVPSQTNRPPLTPAVGTMLPAYDPDRSAIERPMPRANPTSKTSFNRLTSWSR